MQRHEQIVKFLESDFQTPHYHFIAPEGKATIFDPNGAIYWNGRYHLFYIYKDKQSETQAVYNWGHASSKDLLHWEFHPTALSCGNNDVDRSIFSGCAVVSPAGVPTLVYFGVDAGICLATPEDDNLIKWRKSEHNPVIPIPKQGCAGFGVYNVFDPHAWVEGDTAYMILGGNVKPYDLYDTAYLFRSKDMIHWEYLRPFYNPNPHWTNESEDCACPDFFKIGNRYMLLCISHPAGLRYYLGRYQLETFIPEEHHRLNWPGGSCFAPESLLDESGRRIFWAWVLDQRTEYNTPDVMTMPRVLSLDKNGQLLIDVPKEFEALRTNYRKCECVTVEAGNEISLDNISGDVMELLCTIKPCSGSIFGIKVRVSDDLSEQTAIIVNMFNETISVDTSNSSLSKTVYRQYPIRRGRDNVDVPIQIAPFTLGVDEPLTLRIFIDKSIIEIYANRKQCITQRIYPTLKDSVGVKLFSRCGTVEFSSIDAWDIKTTNGVMR